MRESIKETFTDLGIIPPILKALDDMGFEAPTEVQRRAIPHILKKEDLIVMSKTGSGKTAVFGLPILQMTDSDAVEPQALILEPTRELAVQVDNDLKQMSKYLDHKTAAVYGQHSMNIEIQALTKGVSIVTGTPGRLFDHIRQKNLKTRSIRFLILDEADRMLDMGFYDQVVQIIRTLPKDRITLLFSATIPDEIRRICSNHMKDPVAIEIESETMTVDAIEQVYYRVGSRDKSTQLNRLLLTEQPESCMIFCNTRIAVDRVQNFLTRKGYSSQALHGDIPQNKRMKTMQQFKQKKFHILVATDVAARGIDVDGLSLVINYDVPVEKDSYVHRIGRTGRAGKIGRAISLVTTEDIISLYEIEEHIGTMIAEGDLPKEVNDAELRAGAEEWIKANTLERAPSQKSNARDDKRSDKRRGGRSDRHQAGRRTTEKTSAANAPRKSGESGTRFLSTSTAPSTNRTKADRNKANRANQAPTNVGRIAQRTRTTPERSGAAGQYAGTAFQRSESAYQRVGAAPQRTGTKQQRAGRTSQQAASSSTHSRNTSGSQQRSRTDNLRSQTRNPRSQSQNTQNQPRDLHSQEKNTSKRKPFLKRVLDSIFGKE